MNSREAFQQLVENSHQGRLLRHIPEHIKAVLEAMTGRKGEDRAACDPHTYLRELKTGRKTYQEFSDLFFGLVGGEKADFGQTMPWEDAKFFSFHPITERKQFERLYQAVYSENGMVPTAYTCDRVKDCHQALLLKKCAENLAAAIAIMEYYVENYPV